MKTCLFVAALVLTTGTAICGQTSKYDLTRLYGPAENEVFLAGPGLKLKAIYGSSQLVCALVISGSPSERQVITIFDAAIPMQIRGGKRAIKDMELCSGGCQREIEYKNVNLTSLVFDRRQTSEPAAVMTFRRPECNGISEEIYKTTFRVNSIAGDRSAH